MYQRVQSTKHVAGELQSPRQNLVGLDTWKGAPHNHDGLFAYSAVMHTSIVTETIGLSSVLISASHIDPLSKYRIISESLRMLAMQRRNSVTLISRFRLASSFAAMALQLHNQFHLSRRVLRCDGSTWSLRARGRVSEHRIVICSSCRWPHCQGLTCGLSLGLVGRSSSILACGIGSVGFIKFVLYISLHSVMRVNVENLLPIICKHTQFLKQMFHRQ